MPAKLTSTPSKTMSVQEADQNNGLDVYRAWQLARGALSESIQTYLSACDSLSSASFESALQAGTHGASLLPNALAIDAELSELANQEDLLRNGRFDLLASRNRTKGFSKINSFPIEILSSIFIAAKPRFDDPSRGLRYPATLASVCRLWRQIALDLPSIWAYIRIRIDGAHSANSRRCAELWSHRSQRSTLHLDMLQCSITGSPTFFTSDLLSVMSLVAPRVQDFYAKGSRCVTQFALCNLINDGTVGSLKSLELTEYDNSGSGDFLAWFPEIARLAPSHDRTAEFLSSVHTLKLSSVFLPWHSTAYENLVSLSLDLSAHNFGDFAPTQREIANVFLSSPMLHTLSLTLDFPCRDRQSSVVPIRLNSLRSFTLISYKATYCLGFLPLIAPGTHGLETRVRVHSDPAFIEELQSFFARSIVVRLRVDSCEAVSWFETLSKGLSQLRSLCLSNCDFIDVNLLVFVHTSLTSNSRTLPVWPELETLELLGCQIDNKILLHLLSIHSIRKIQILRGCCNPPSRQSSADFKAMSMRELVERISVIVPETTYRSMIDE